MQIKINIKLVFIIVGLLMSNTGHAQRISCKSFDHQSEAQRYFDTKNKGWKNLIEIKIKKPVNVSKVVQVMEIVGAKVGGRKTRSNEPKIKAAELNFRSSVFVNVC